MKVSVMDASHKNPLGAYAAVNTIRLDDLKPHIYRTRDGGKTWTHITTGIPDGATVNTVKEDPKRAGLLYAGTETQVYVSLDDGDHWQSLRQNMPATSIRDLVIKDDDLVVGTHGRGFWILDGISSLRELQPGMLQEDAHLFKPGDAIRFEWNRWPDTPLPPDEPSSPNPPDGAIVEYHLKQPASGVVTLEILDRAGAVIRRFAATTRRARSVTKGTCRPTGSVRREFCRRRPDCIVSCGTCTMRRRWDRRRAIRSARRLATPSRSRRDRSWCLAAIRSGLPRMASRIRNRSS
jgi:hypothetical protein